MKEKAQQKRKVEVATDRLCDHGFIHGTLILQNKENNKMQDKSTNGQAFELSSIDELKDKGIVNTKYFRMSNTPMSWEFGIAFGFPCKSNIEMCQKLNWPVVTHYFNLLFFIGPLTIEIGKDATEEYI